MKSSKLIGFGAYSPKKIVTNDDLSKIMDTNDEWISTRTGVKSRHIAEENEQTSDLGHKAFEQALSRSKLQKEDIELLIVATATPDLLFPSTACIIQKKADLKNAVCFDVTAACSGFLYALSIANAYIKSGKYKNVAVIGAEKMSKLIDWTDRATAILFGDGAGCFILQASDEETGIIDDIIKSSGYEGDILTYDYISAEKKITMQGSEVFKHAVSKMSDISKEILEKNNMTLNDIKYLIPHQANSRIVEGVAKYMDAPMDKVIMKVDHFANTSSASIPLAFCEAYEEGNIKEGDTLLFTALGAGITWGALLIKV